MVMGRMGVELILPVKVLVTISTMLNFDRQNVFHPGVVSVRVNKAL